MKYSEEETSIIEKWIKEHIWDNEMICRAIINISPKDVDYKTAGKYYSDFYTQINFALALNAAPELLSGYPSKIGVEYDCHFQCNQILCKAIAKIKLLQMERDENIASIEHSEEVERRVEAALKKLKGE